MDNRRDDECDAGLSTVFAALAVGVLMVVAGIGIRLGGAMLAREQAETAADLGALAGASKVLQGNVMACARAATVVTANGGVMRSCTLQGLDLLVEAEVGSWGGAASGRARAGPAQFR